MTPVTTSRVVLLPETTLTLPVFTALVGHLVLFRALLRSDADA